MNYAMSPAKRRRSRRFDSLQQEVYLGLWRTYDLLKAFEEELFGRYGLTAQQYNLLRILAASDPVPLPTLDVASKLISRAPDITRMVDKLEERGLVRRERQVNDRRVVQIGLTDEGKEIIEGLKLPLRECHEEQLGHLSKTELKALSALLRAAREVHESPDSPWR